jgi:HSP20 family molecular chaperone IbpA
MVEEPKESKNSDLSREKQDEERIARLEKRINELESTAKSSSRGGGDIQVGGLVENVVGQFIPGLGGIIKALEASSPEFRQRIADTDAEIKHRIDVGWSSKPVVDYHVSTRPMRRGVGKPTARTDSVRMPEAPFREPIVDVLDGNGCMTVIAELPGVSEDELNVKLDESDLEITAGRFSKRITLPRAVKEIVDKSYKNGILQIKLN